MKKLIYLILSVLILASASAFINRVYSEPGDMIVTVFNHETSNIKNAQVSVFIPDMDVRAKSSQFKIRANEADKVHMEINVPENVKPDYYPVIVTFRNDDVRQKRHTWVYIK